MQNLYNKKSTCLSVTKESWKCFRCNLCFKNEEHGKIHEEITSHHIRIIKSLIA